MPPIRSSALRGAIAITLFTAACGDTAVEPNPTHALPRAAELTTTLTTHSFSGRAADSMLKVLETGWARIGRGDERNARLAWRKRNGVPDSVHDSLLAPPQVAPNVNLAVVTSDVERPAPIVLTHFEQLHWGYRDAYLNLPASIAAEMAFSGDNGEISVGNFTMTATQTGYNYKGGGQVAAGPGEIINCSDVLLDQCSNRRHLGGVLTLQNAPFCDATANGNVTYSATNGSTSTGQTIFGGVISSGSGGSTSISVGISGTAPSCQTAQAPPPVQQPQTPTDPGGGPTPPPPSAPWVPDPPPPPTNTGPVNFYCGTVLIYQNVNGEDHLLAEADVCFPA
ncbi:MAG: hypothetical protein ACJ796_07535 [Gemmatimonadaceae bacterium]